MSNDPRWHLRIHHMRDQAQAAQSFLQGVTYDEFVNDLKLTHAVTRSIQIIGEAANKLPPEIREQYPHIPWRVMIGMRNVLVHDYEDIDTLTLWETVKRDLPTLERELSLIVPPPKDIP